MLLDERREHHTYTDIIIQVIIYKVDACHDIDLPCDLEERPLHSLGSVSMYMTSGWLTGLFLCPPSAFVIGTVVCEFETLED